MLCSRACVRGLARRASDLGELPARIGWRPADPQEGIEAWTDEFATWRKELRLKVGADQDVTTELEEGARILEEGVVVINNGTPAQPNGVEIGSTTAGVDLSLQGGTNTLIGTNAAISATIAPVGATSIEV